MIASVKVGKISQHIPYASDMYIGKVTSKGIHIFFLFSLMVDDEMV